MQGWSLVNLLRRLECIVDLSTLLVYELHPLSVNSQWGQPRRAYNLAPGLIQRFGPDESVRG